MFRDFAKDPFSSLLFLCLRPLLFFWLSLSFPGSAHPFIKIPSGWGEVKT